MKTIGADRLLLREEFLKHGSGSHEEKSHGNWASGGMAGWRGSGKGTNPDRPRYGGKGKPKPKPESKPKPKASPKKETPKPKAGGGGGKIAPIKHKWEDREWQESDEEWEGIRAAGTEWAKLTPSQFEQALLGPDGQLAISVEGSPKDVKGLEDLDRTDPRGHDRTPEDLKGLKPLRERTTKEQFRAIADYQAVLPMDDDDEYLYDQAPESSYYRINKALRSGGKLTSAQQRQVDLIESTAITTTKPMTVWRGMNSAYLPDIGGEWTGTGLTSVSTDRLLADGFGRNAARPRHVLVRLVTKPGTKAIPVSNDFSNATAGFDAESGVGSEAEIIFPRGTKFKVTGRTRTFTRLTDDPGGDYEWEELGIQEIVEVEVSA